MKSAIKILFVFGFVVLSAGQCVPQSVTWQRVYGGNGIQYGYGIIQTTEGGYIGVGRKFQNIYVFRLNQFGDTIWTREYPGFEAVSIIRASDSNYIILGAQSDIIKISLNGETIWNRNYGNIHATGIKEGFDGSLTVSRILENGFLRKASLLKLKSNGDVIFQKQYLNNYFDSYFEDIVIDSQGNYVICGSISDSSLISNKFFLLKTDSNGNEIWVLDYDSLYFFYPQSMIINGQNEFLVGGVKNNHSTICKFNDSGEYLFTKIFDSLKYSVCNSIVETIDRGYVFTGTFDSTNSTYYLRVYKLDKDCNEEWRKSFGFNDNDAGYGIKQTVDSGYIIIGIRDNFNSGDIYVIKTDKSGNANPFVRIDNNFITILSSTFLSQNYPNPFNPRTVITYQISKRYYVTLKVFNIFGKEIFNFVNSFKNQGQYEQELDFTTRINGLSSGVYFYALFLDGKLAEKKKMILLK